MYKLILCILICVLIGFAGSFFTDTGSWYTSLNKPSFNPPSYVFAPVWTILYILMGIAVYMLWQGNAKTAIILFIIQLVLNLVWTFLFFKMHSPLLALIDIVLLLSAIAWTMIESYKVSHTAVYLLIPYILWVSFATMLNLSIYLLN
jgi:tryptophan-rich sensory protein